MTSPRARSPPATRHGFTLVEPLVVIAIVAILAALLLPALAAQGGQPVVGYRVEGVLDCTFYRATGTAWRTQRWDFAMEVVGNSWRLQQTWSQTPHEIVCDGTNVVDVAWDPSPAVTAPPAVVHGDGFPALGYPTEIPWLAYASGAYLDQGRELSAPWAFVRSSPLAHMHEAKVTRLREAPGLPLSVVYTARAGKGKAARRNPMLRIEGVSDAAFREQPLEPGLLADGVVSGIYSALSVTNVGQATLPVRFEVIHYQDLKITQAHRRTNAVAARFIGTATNVSLTENRLTWPALRRPVSVADRRFQSAGQGVDCIQYIVTNQWIIAATDARLIRLFEAKRRAAPFVRFMAWKEWLIGCAFAMLACLPATVWWLQRRRRPAAIQ